ncbi:hypothetical protein [Pseudomonas aeruginosa]|uniref:hypothetical protein n=1 Tax=Pseudomonas aeruginosa TaxID=287 RepID=UPI0024B36998|nr:hypothetical protein [Pseudomonas aeruginosa]WHM65336.1 hypothetical protein QMK40_32770 [Pseudomonas aeruginosa]
MVLRAGQRRSVTIRPRLSLGVDTAVGVVLRAGQRRGVTFRPCLGLGVDTAVGVVLRAGQCRSVAIRPRLSLGVNTAVGVVLGSFQRRRVTIFPGFRFSLDRAVSVVVRARQGCSIAGVAGLSLGRHLLIRMIDRLAEDACVLLSACLRFVGDSLVRVVRGRAENPVILVCPLLRLCAHLGVGVALRRGQGRGVTVLDLAEIRCIGPRGSSGNVGDLSFGAGGADRYGVVPVVARPCAEGDAVAGRRRGCLTDRNGSPARHRMTVANSRVALPGDVVAGANNRCCPVRRIDLVRVPDQLAICVRDCVALAFNCDIAVGDGVVVANDLRRHSVVQGVVVTNDHLVIGRGRARKVGIAVAGYAVPVASDNGVGEPGVNRICSVSHACCGNHQGDARDEVFFRTAIECRRTINAPAHS